ncbi:hypothetical protein JY651_27340 [Pyxidicoccus parkwayensis]|uniref:Diiron oxygenase n=1 Tax=Pyxidicoccus parkwayensis TaxID=2813578 RepID=A0ABX7NJM6_9BACT|nr:hypothetical protein [Pyxidicoccus parkwaysis]QSQ19062.1 hypothetical protein JY651_27340 [Pyxidicoccus parkwaysis]
MPSPGYSYETILTDALKVGWRVEDIIGGDKRLDFTRPFLPDALAGVKAIGCLSPAEKLKLNQIRGNSYLHLFGLVEEFILPFVMDHARQAVHGENVELRAMVTFAEEEAKHMHLFKRFSEEFARGFGTPCAGVGPAHEIAAAVLSHSALGVGLVTLHLEWLTLYHYLESVRTDESIDPRFASLLRHHWMEESQHAKLDSLLVQKIASTLSSEQVEAGIDDFLVLGNMLHDTLMAQARLDLESLTRAVGRTLSDAEQREIIEAQQKSYRRVMLAQGMTQPNFVKVVEELSPRGMARVSEVARALG